MSSTVERHPVTTFEERLICSCGGEFTCTGALRWDDKARVHEFEHRCGGCGAVEHHAGAGYPNVRHLRPDGSRAGE